MADQTTTTSAPDWLQPYWTNYLNQTMGLTQNPIPVYGGPTVAPFNQNQNTAADMQYQLATNGTMAGNAANNAITQQAGGVANPYMGNGPQFQSMLSGINNNMADAYARGTAAQTDAAAARGGAYGGSAYNELTGANNQAFANAVGNVDSNLAYQNYQNSGNLFNQDQNRQLQAAGLGLSSQGVDQNAINGLFGIGTAQQGTTQNTLDAMRNQFTNTVQSPFATLDVQGNAISRAGGGQSTTTVNGPGNSDWMNILGSLGLLGTIFQ